MLQDLVILLNLTPSGPDVVCPAQKRTDPTAIN